MRLRNFLMAALCLFGFSELTLAHENAKGPHGGIIVEMAPYHAEFEVMIDMLHIYVIGDKNETLDVKDVTGSIVIQFPDGKKTQDKLKAMGSALMVSAPVAPQKSFVAIATIKIKDKSYSARYSHKAKKSEKDKD